MTENTEEELQIKFFEMLERLALAEGLKNMGKVKRLVKGIHKPKLVEKEEFYCPHCQRKTQMHEIPTKSRKNILYSILVCDKCFTFLSKI
jgi:hypothetical protein